MWGITNKRWRICRDGKFQSPINIPPQSVRFDPLLAQSLLFVSGSNSVHGDLENTGQELQFRLDSQQSGIVSLDGGPLSYTYRLSHIKLRYGEDDRHGSEHSVNGFHFAAEMQLIFYNDYLFLNYDEALGKAHGIAALSVFVQESDNDTNSEFQKLFHGLNKVAYKGEKKRVDGVNVRELLPLTHHYITYSGSLTAPPCSEGVTWILYNRPINIPRWQIRNLRNKIIRSEKERIITEPADDDVKYMRGNTRPLQHPNRKLHLWTNVRTRLEGGQGPASCSGYNDPSIMKYSINNLYTKPTISQALYQNASSPSEPITQQQKASQPIAAQEAASIDQSQLRNSLDSSQSESRTTRSHQSSINLGNGG
ncbi:carbonic anhydrase-related protein 10-like [Convolutriloba macropyga]|uniref:carbonic anhydrase-related protein 10-like n=1 Tax=Convolutriloba macropyga TaxID=536237 RepID=UPI003F520970